MHSLFKDDAMNFYQNEIEWSYFTFDNTLKRTWEEFNPHSKQQQVHRKLRATRFEGFEYDARTTAEALYKLNSSILSKTHQVKLHYKNEETKSEFLRDTVTGCSWAWEVSMQIANSAMTYWKSQAKIDGVISIKNFASNRAEVSIFPTNFTRGTKICERRSKFFLVGRTIQKTSNVE